MKGLIRRLIRANDKRYLRYRMIRMWFVRRRYGLSRVDPTFFMHTPRYVSPDLVAGAFTFLNSGSYICPNVEIGRYVMFGPDVLIMGGDHRFDRAGLPSYFAGREAISRTIIGDDVWVGARSLIRAGVTIGRGAIVGMGAVVVKDVADYSIVGGNPARVLGERFSERERTIHDEMLERGDAQFLFVKDFDVREK